MDPKQSPNWLSGNRIFRLAKHTVAEDSPIAARQLCSTGGSRIARGKEFGPKSGIEDSGAKDPCEDARTGQCSRWNLSAY